MSRVKSPKLTKKIWIKRLSVKSGLNVQIVQLVWNAIEEMIKEDVYANKMSYDPAKKASMEQIGATLPGIGQIYLEGHRGTKLNLDHYGKNKPDSGNFWTLKFKPTTLFKEKALENQAPPKESDLKPEPKKSSKKASSK